MELLFNNQIKTTMFVLPRNESDANKIQKVASMICEAFYREKTQDQAADNKFRDDGSSVIHGRVEYW